MSARRLPDRPRISLLLRLLHEEYANAVEAALAEAGYDDLRGGKAKVFPLVPDEGIPIGQLADLVGVRKQTMAETVDQLVASGYLATRPHPRDRRSRLVSLSPKGKRARPVAAAAGDRVEQRWAEVTSERDVELLRQLLRRLLVALADAGEEYGDPAADGSPA